MKQLETVTQTVRIYSQCKGLEIGIEKCTLLIMKSRKRYMTERMELPNQEKIRRLGEKEYVQIADTIKQIEMKEK